MFLRFCIHVVSMLSLITLRNIFWNNNHPLFSIVSFARVTFHPLLILFIDLYS